MKRPNVLYLHSHDTGRHIAPYGYDVPTPHLLDLAGRGVTFRNAFCVSPTCSPARAGLLTGQWPHQCGQWGLCNRGYPLEHPERHLAHTLNRAGYRTCLMGVQHVSDDEAATGYAHIAPEVVGYHWGGRNDATDAAAVAGRVASWLDDHGRSAGPWFIDAGMIQTHTGAWPLVPDEAVPSAAEVNRARPPAIVPDTEEARHWYAMHRVMARQLDDGVGRILARLDALGLRDDTLVIFTTDHGLGLPTAKCNLTDAGLEVALILHGPGGFEGGRTLHPMVDHLDLYPTVCDLADIERPGWLEGRPLQPLVRGEVDRLHDALFSEINVHGGPQPERSVRTERHRLVRRWSTTQQVKHNCDPKPVRDHMAAAGWPERMPPGRPARGGANDLLFDLQLDPTHRVDRSGDPPYADAYADLTGRLERWMRRTNDPLLQGAGSTPGPRPFESPPRPDASIGGKRPVAASPP